MSGVTYCCPLCKGELSRRESYPIPPGEDRVGAYGQRLRYDGAYHCRACDRAYPIVFGIPDFRVFPDPYLSISDDHRKALALAEQYDAKGYRELAELYWSITPEEPRDLVARYMRYDMAGEARGRHMLGVIKEESKRVFDRRHSFLELGCRTGGVSVAAAEVFGRVVGIDIAFRWLIVAKKRAEQQGQCVAHVCCCAQYLPFKDGAFDLVFAGNVLEHSRQQERIVSEGRRVLRPGGVFYATTCNRYWIGAEPHVRVWGVGFLPRSLMGAYVMWRKGVTYRNVRLLSGVELMGMVRRAFGRGTISPPAVSEQEQEGLSPRERRMIGRYNRLRTWGPVRYVLLLIGPLLQVMCIRPNDDGADQ